MPYQTHEHGTTLVLGHVTDCGACWGLDSTQDVRDTDLTPSQQEAAMTTHANPAQVIEGCDPWTYGDMADHRRMIVWKAERIRQDIADLVTARKVSREMNDATALVALDEALARLGQAEYAVVGIEYALGEDE